jgi:hypothetical protein
MYITRLASNKIFSLSNKINREVGQAKDLSAPLYVNGFCHRLLTNHVHAAAIVCDRF